jgi:hypothetical protein
MGVPRSSVYQTSHGPLTTSMGGEIWLLQILPEGLRGKFSSSCSEIDLVCKSDLKPAMAERLFSQQMPETVSLRSFNDLDVSAERSQPMPPSEDPYIYTPLVAKTIPELLGVDNQIPPGEVRDRYKITFPSNLDIYDRTEAGGSFQWLSQGWYAGSRVGPAMLQFSFRNGMTFRDQGVVAEGIVKEKLLGMWRYVVWVWR